MFYALRRRAGSDRQTLVEFSGKHALQAALTSAVISFSSIDADAARRWVAQGREHETGLFIDEGRIRYGPRHK